MQSFFNLPREFASTILSAVFISPHINAKMALDELYMVVNCLKTTNPDDLFIIAGDFNQATLKNMLSRYHQHVSCLMKHVNTLDYYYTTIRYLSLHLSPSFQSVWSFVGAAHAGLQTKVEARAIKEENNAAVVWGDREFTSGLPWVRKMKRISKTCSSSSTFSCSIIKL